MVATTSSRSRKKPWRTTQVACVAKKILLASYLFLGTTAFVQPLVSHTYHNFQQFERRTTTLYSSTPAPHDLEKLTVKELRQMIVDHDLMKRGLSSRLKRKQDIIDYLQERLPRDKEDVGIVESQKKQPLGMPPLDASLQENGVAKINGENKESENPTTPSPKDIIFEKVYQRYPMLRDENFTKFDYGDHDIRQQNHPMMKNNTESDFELLTLGTASCAPGVTRGVSCTALRLRWRRQQPSPHPDKQSLSLPTAVVGGGTWLFDVGEGTQIQIQKTNYIKPSRISKIFLTHAHGDHTFGLPGLMCSIGQDFDRDGPPVEIYGPEGLRMWLRVAIRYSASRIVPRYRVHEIKNVPIAPEWTRHRWNGKYINQGHMINKNYRRKQQQRVWGNKGLAGEDPTSWVTSAYHMNLQPSVHYGEVEGGRDIMPIFNHPKSSDGAPVWELEDEQDVKVYAAPMSHSVPCVGYVVEEKSKPGRLRNELVEPIVRRNVDALREKGFRVPMKAMAVIKNMPEGSSFTFPDGTVVTQEDAVEPERLGRKVVILGDTADARAIAALAEGADVLVHEATNTFLPGVDRGTNLTAVTKDTIIHGHSTPYMAGEFAKRIGAKRLVLNHFSARYKGDQSADSISLSTRIEMQAMDTSGLDETCVAAAWDFMQVTIPPNQ